MNDNNDALDAPRRDEFFDPFKAEAGRRALRAVRALCLPPSIMLAQAELSGVSPKHDAAARSDLETVIDRWANATPFVLALADRLAWFSVWSGAEWLNVNADALADAARRGEKLTRNGVEITGDDLRELAQRAPSVLTAEDHAGTEGWAWTLYNELCTVDEGAEHAELRAECGLAPILFRYATLARADASDGGGCHDVGC